MKSDILIKDDLHMFIKSSKLAAIVSGKICKESIRPKGSTKEDIVISVIANMNGQIQEAEVNINIYVSDDIQSNGQNREATVRLRELCEVAAEALESGGGDDYRFTLESQRVFAVEDTREHVINNRIIYKQINE